MRDIDFNNNYIADELPNNDSALQEVLDFSFMHYELEREFYNLNSDMESSVNNIYTIASTISVQEIDNIFSNKNLKTDECSICINNEKLMKCYHCVGHICKSCTMNIYRTNNQELKCPFCNQVLDLQQLTIHNRNVYSIPPTNKNRTKKKPKSNSNQYKCHRDQNIINIETNNLQYAIENVEKYNDSDYNSGSSDIEAFDYDDSKKNEFSYRDKKIGFKTSLYGYEFIQINPINNNRKKLVFPKKFYNCKYLLILYSILLEFKRDKEWNDFVTRFLNHGRMEKFQNSSNFRKRFIWQTYLDTLL